MRPLLFLVTVVLLCLPAVAQASVIITEVAWMGSAVSANHEWIELYNNGSSAVSVDGWTLSDGASLLITLSGSLGAGDYAVLERTSDDTVAGTAFLIYTGALVNTGATLTLRRDDGQIEDRVEGGANWQSIGGDNVTKDTAQYTGTVWQTAAPTPGMAASGTGISPTPTTPTIATGTVSNPTTTTGGGSSGTTLGSKARSATVPLKKTDSSLQLAIAGQEVMYVHQPVTFTAVGTGVGKTIAASLQYRWNMGDLTMATGSKVTHRFDHPGTYLVVVQARFGKHDVVARKEVKVLPVKVSLSRDEHGQVLVQNDSVYDVDVSGYRIETTGKTMVFPPLSFLAAKQAIPLPADDLVSDVRLRDPHRRLLAHLKKGEDNRGESILGSENVLTPVTPAVLSQPAWLPLAGEKEAVSFAEIGEPAIATTLSEGVQQELVGAEETVTTTANKSANTTRWPYGVAALLLVSTLGFIWWPRSVSV